MRSWSAAVGLILLGVTIGTGVAVEAFGFAGVGRESHVNYYPGGPPRPGTPVPTPTKTPITSVTFAVDADPTADGVQATRPGSVPIGANFTVDIVLFGDVVPGYMAYQVFVQFDDVVFDAVGLPPAWEDAAVIDVTSGTPSGTLFWPSGSLCDPNPASRSLVGEDDSGNATLTMTCASFTFGELTSYRGALVTLVFQCEQSGTGLLDLGSIRNTFLLDFNIKQYNDGVSKGSVTCGEGAPASTGTPTPAAPTETPTPSPTHTATPSPTPGPCVIADVDGDGRVTGKDVAAVIRAMRRAYDDAADLNHDGVVDFKDLKLVVNALRAQRC